MAKFRYSVTCRDCGEIEADTGDGLYDKATANRRAGFHEGSRGHDCDVEIAEETNEYRCPVCQTKVQLRPRHSESASMTGTETRELVDDQLTALTQLEELLDNLANDREVYDYQVREGVEAVETAQEHTVEMLDRAGVGETDHVVLDLEEAKRVANSLEMLYYDTKESAYDATDEQAALDAMAIRERGGIEPNPELLEQPEDTDGETDG